MSIKKIDRVFFEHSYKQVVNEYDGERYETFAGFEIICQTTEASGKTTTFWVLKDHESGFEFNKRIWDLASAKELVAKIEAKGEINTSFWEGLYSKPVGVYELELDYVTDPHRPEFN